MVSELTKMLQVNCTKDRIVIIVIWEIEKDGFGLAMDIMVYIQDANIEAEILREKRDVEVSIDLAMLETVYLDPIS